MVMWETSRSFTNEVYDAMTPEIPPNAPPDLACYAEHGRLLVSRPDILDLPGRCWTVHAKDEADVSWPAPGGNAVKLDWKPCDYKDQGFRTEITQPWSVPDFSKVSQNPWGVGDDVAFPRVHYHWTFELDDSSRLIGNWASGAFVAQWHSERPAPVDGSPVIGLLYERSLGLKDHEAYLTLTAKVLGSTGQCLPGDEKVVNNHDGESICFKRMARAVVADDRRVDVDVDIVWGDAARPGRLKVAVDGMPLDAVKPYHADESGAYVVPIKQNGMPNYFSVGLYVQSRYKALYQKKPKSDGMGADDLSFCGPRGHVSLVFKDFSFKSVRSDGRGPS
jgi:hypothetical protein